MMTNMPIQGALSNILCKKKTKHMIQYVHLHHPANKMYMYIFFITVTHGTLK